MSRLIVRFAKRLSSWDDETSDDDLLQTEFWEKDRDRLDLRPSVYEIDPQDVVRAFSEHATAFNPPASAGGFDMSGTGHGLLETPGTTGFAFTTHAHRELVVLDREDLLELIREVRRLLPERRHQVSRDQVHTYVKERLAENDGEWTLARSAIGAPRWLKRLGA